MTYPILPSTHCRLTAALSMSFLIILITNSCRAYRMLIMPLSSQSHIIAMTSLSKELIRRGHEVHMTLPASYKLTSDLAANDSKIHVQRFGKSDENLDYENVQATVTAQVLERKAGIGEIMELLKGFAEGEARCLLHKNDEFIERLEKINFDIAIVDHLFFMKFQFLIPLRLRIPWITYGDMLPFWNVRVPHLPSFVPSKMSAYSDRMSFFQRAMNLLYSLVPQVYAFPEPPEEIVVKYRNYGKFQNMDDLISKSQLFMVTSDVALDYPIPSMPNVIQVGGISMQVSNGNKLPKDIDDFMLTGRDGVVLVTFGSMLSHLPRDIAGKFLKAFGELSTYRFIWRFTNSDNLSIPENVMLAKWLPQNDILLDQRLKLFITHSGNNGQFEALYHAVPMIGFPVHGDQYYNAERLRSRGYGIPMNLYDFTSQELVGNIMKILGDESYRKRIKKGSEIFRSARETPGERAAYWIEHVIRFGGEHLRSAGNDLNFFQYFLLDVVLFIAMVLLTVLATTVLCIRYLYRRFICRKQYVVMTLTEPHGSVKKIN